MSTKNLNTPEEYEEYLKELRITYSFECFKEDNAEACHLLGDWFSQFKQPKEAIDHYRYACEKFKYPRSCYKYGVSLVDGKEVGAETDIKKALHFTSLACELGEPEGCWRNAQILQLEKKFPEALKQHTKYCEMNHYFSHNSCYDAGLILRSPQDVTSVPQDFTKAFHFFSKSCDLLNSNACYEVSVAYKLGRGVGKDESLAKKFLQKAKDMQEGRFS
ncbi:Cytochrome c oxidase assembly factor 7-like protein [Frankliniella fusca]|uniref:Cytochrome c oxidase assembly factor 7-like protein n=1 Tax=Frankliniella fusca TaxID=407009 RepID=A0AAE1I2C0_9NEOP|nr:Cytochrome c oxidase assembly factor 7-like protein [Frankliniella fusca]